MRRSRALFQRFVLLSFLAATFGCMRNDMGASRTLASQSPVSNVDQWIVTWLGQAPAMSERITLSRTDHRVCSLAHR